MPPEQLIGYLFAVVIAHFPIKLVMTKLWNVIEPLEQQATEKLPARPMTAWLPTMVGWIERGLYVWSLQEKKVEFIGLWLSLKLASQFLESRGAGYHRKGYYAFFIGNGLSIAYSGIGFLLIGWLTSRSWSMALEHSLGLVLCTMVLYYWIVFHGKRAAGSK